MGGGLRQLYAGFRKLHLAHAVSASSARRGQHVCGATSGDHSHGRPTRGTTAARGLPVCRGHATRIRSPLHFLELCSRSPATAADLGQDDGDGGRIPQEKEEVGKRSSVHCCSRLKSVQREVPNLDASRSGHLPGAHHPRVQPCASVLSQNYFLNLAAHHVIPRATRRAGPEESAFVFSIHEESRFLASLGMTTSLFQRIHNSGDQGKLRICARRLRRSSAAAALLKDSAGAWRSCSMVDSRVAKNALQGWQPSRCSSSFSQSDSSSCSSK